MDSSNGGFHQLPSTVIPGETLQLITTYNSCAGQSAIAGVAKDAHGNARGAEFDLGVDGAFEGMEVIVLQLYGFSMDNTIAAMEQKGFSVRLLTTPPPLAAFVEALEDKKCCQLWIISGHSQQLSTGHLDAIKQFFERGRGV